MTVLSVCSRINQKITIKYERIIEPYLKKLGVGSRYTPSPRGAIP